MKILQVKYCYTEQELNDFLKTLHVDSTTPRLHCVQYMANMHGDGVQTEEADNNGVVANMTINNGIIAMIQYFVEVE